MTTLIRQLLLKKKKDVPTNNKFYYCSILWLFNSNYTFKDFQIVCETFYVLLYYCITVNASIGAARCP